MNKVFRSPSRYIQGDGVLRQLDQYMQGMGNKVLVIIDSFVEPKIKPMLEESFDGKNFEVFYETFKGEACQKTIDGLVELGKAKSITAVIGIGGGKAIDTSKATAFYLGRPMIIVPTAASTDAPCSSLSIIYSEEGVFDRYLFLDSSPNMVVVDTGVIVGAPVKLLVAGMGDALATYFEARACRASGSNNQTAGLPTYAASGLAKMCWENLKRDGYRAKQAVEAGVCTEAVERIVETNTYLSSVGFESGGLAAAHGIQKGFTVIPQLHRQLHGFNVAFCTIAQLILEDAHEELYEVLEFCESVGLPICFEDLGYPEADREMLMKAAEKACVPTSTIHHMPFEVTTQMVFNSLIAADAAGRAFRQSRK